MRKKTLWNSIVGSLFIAIFSVSANAVPIMFFDFNGDSAADPQTTVDIGDSFLASLYISGIDSTHGGILNWGSETLFDPAVLNATSYSIDPIWEIVGVANNINNSAGTVELLAGTFLSTQTGVIKLADITFSALALGASTLSLRDYASGVPTFSATVGADGYVYDNEIDFRTANVRVVEAVPAPTTLWLFCLGLLTLSLRYRHFSLSTRA